jgi:BirA family biotin operon repressor/biotin-[acetyl-CoA-carboxylase] ligase
LLDGAKVAGILIEGQAGAATVGIGVNCVSHPVGTEYPATDLAGVSPAQLFRSLSARMFARLAQWNAGVGFGSIRAEWLARAAGVGETLRVRLPNREITGRFETLDEEGGLRLRLADGGVTTIAAGDVFMCAPAQAGS